MRKKENNLIDKFVKRNYKNELEAVLEKKYFDESSQGLLLEILYKIETVYKDYEKVKKDVESQEEYIERFIQIIKDDCKEIKIVRPNSEQSKILENRTFLINKDKEEIICLPIARKLLYAISKISKKDIIVKDKYFLVNKTISNLINIGNNINTVEPIRDFNGWSWSTVPREIESIEYNLIYQIMIILVGTKFLNNWIQNKEFLIDYLEELENILENKYGKIHSGEIIHILTKISVLMELKVNNSIKQEMQQEKNKLETQMRQFNQKEGFIQELTQEKNKLKQQIGNIDTIINNKNLLQQEYIKRNEKLPLEKKIFSMRILTQIMIEEREKLCNKLDELNELLKPTTFSKARERIQDKLKYVELAMVEDEEKELQDSLIWFQKIFLSAFREKIKQAITKVEITELIYQFRYYCLLPFNEKSKINDINEIKIELRQTGIQLIQKATESKVIINFSQNIDINYEIIKEIFTLRAISLEELSVKVTKEKDAYYIQFFDENSEEQKIRLNIDNNLDKKQITVKLNKKQKLFE